VRSLGWVEICEDDLTAERSSKAVNKCIVDLSLGRNDFIDNVGRWGDVSTNTEIPLLTRADTRGAMGAIPPVHRKISYIPFVFFFFR